MTSTATHAIVVRIVADLGVAIARNATGCFEIQELQAVCDHLRVIASRKLTDVEFNAKGRLLLAGLIELAKARDVEGATRCLSHLGAIRLPFGIPSRQRSGTDTRDRTGAKLARQEGCALRVEAI